MIIHRTNKPSLRRESFIMPLKPCRSLRQFYRAKFLRHAGSSRDFLSPRESTDREMLALKKKEERNGKKRKRKGKKKGKRERGSGSLSTWVWHGASWPARGVIHPVIRPEIKIYPIKNSKYLFRLMAVPWITLLIPGLSGWLTDKGTKILRKQILRFQRGLYKTGKIIYGHGFMFLCGLASRNKIVTTSGLPCRRNYDL